MQWSVKQVYRAAWQDLKANKNAWAIMMLLLVVPMWLTLGVPDPVVRVIVNLLMMILSLIAVKISLRIVDGQTPVLESILPSISIYLKMLVVFFLLAVPFLVLGLVATIAPFFMVAAVIVAIALGAVAILMMTLLYYVMLDTDGGIIETIRDTFSLVKKCPLMLAWFVVVSALINMAGLLPLTLGLLVTLPLSLIAGARVYRALNPVETIS
jgi:hypothetical protein